MKKRIIAIAIMVVMALGVFGMSGCNDDRWYESDYYIYTKQNHSVTKEQLVVIVGLTELGKEKSILVIPTEIGGIRVASVGTKLTNKLGKNPATYTWSSVKLEKVFFTASQVATSESLFNGCPNMTRIIIIDYDISQVRGGGGIPMSANRESRPYFVSKQIFDESTLSDMRPANITYILDENVENNVYWIDDLDYGNKIEFIPHDPVKTGYTFGGWYKEPDCQNKWNFDTDTLPQELFDNNGEVIYQETKLFAKWTKV